MGIFSKFFGGEEEGAPEGDAPSEGEGEAAAGAAPRVAPAEAPRAPLPEPPKPALRAPPAPPAASAKKTARQATLGYDGAAVAKGRPEQPAAAPPPAAAAKPASAPRAAAARPIVPQPAPRTVGKVADPVAMPPKSTSTTASVFGVAQEGEGDLERALTDEIDTRFKEVQKAPPRGKEPSAAERKAQAAADAAAVRATFLEVAGAHLRQLRDAMLEIRHGSAPLALGPAGAALRSVETASQQLDDPELATLFGELGKRLRTAESAASAEERAVAMDALLSAYGAVARLSPEALGLEGEHDRREPIIVRSLLSCVPGVQKLTVEKLYAAGLGRLSALLSASALEIEQTTGIPAGTARDIAESVAWYVREAGGTATALDGAKERERLRLLLEELRREHEGFERAAERWSDADFDEKRRRRGARDRVLRQIDLALARLGAVDAVRALERVPVARRIERLAGLVAK